MQTKNGFTKTGRKPTITEKQIMLYKTLTSLRLNELITRVKNGVLHTHIMTEISKNPKNKNTYNYLNHTK